MKFPCRDGRMGQPAVFLIRIKQAVFIFRLISETTGNGIPDKLNFFPARAFFPRQNLPFHKKTVDSKSCFQIFRNLHDADSVGFFRLALKNQLCLFRFCDLKTAAWDMLFIQKNGYPGPCAALFHISADCIPFHFRTGLRMKRRDQTGSPEYQFQAAASPVKI